ncbi:MAG: formylglycine-generating enzyme family protein [Deltaproteobacteria bacterium]|nr:formylglycine-generating enzyme family protein [Deltaproteobacteria bacterium]
MGAGSIGPVDFYSSAQSSEGVYNLVGNALEWVSDYYAPYDPPAGEIVENPQGPPLSDKRVLKGGTNSIPSSYLNTERLIVDAEVAESVFDEW